MHNRNGGRTLAALASVLSGVLLLGCKDDPQSLPTPAEPAEITAIEPLQAVAGQDSLRLDVRGRNFTASMRVHWDGAARPTQFLSSSQLTARITAADLAQHRTVAITVVDSAGRATAAVSFTITPAPVASASGTIAAGSLMTCAVADSGPGYCWGRPIVGGNAQPTPTLVGGGVSWSSLSVANGYMCGVSTAGRAYCWGDDLGAGRLGHGITFHSEEQPRAVVGDLRFSSISTGLVTTCAIEEQRRLYCWGSGDDGQLGETGLLGATRSPVQVALPQGVDAQAVALGSRHVCILSVDGDAYCWGRGPARGSADPGSAAAAARPTLVAGGLKFKRIAASDTYTCALSTAGAAYCWGQQQFGRLGSATESSARPQPVNAAAVFVQITTGPDHACALTADGRAYCWGATRFGRLGNGGDPSAGSSIPVAVQAEVRFNAISAGATHTCAIAVNGAGYCWGDTSSGQIGNGQLNLERTTPAAVAGGRLYSTISASQGSACAVAQNTVYCWGINDQGQLGDGSRTDRNVPTPVAGAAAYRAVAHGSTHACALAMDGTAYCWGRGRFGQLGDGRNEDSTVPVRVATTLRFRTIAAGPLHSCALTEDGRAYCWGAGDLGNGSSAGSSVPVAVTGDFRFVSISIQQSAIARTCALTQAGEGYCWGITSGSTPTRIALAVALAELTASCAIDQAGRAHCYSIGIPICQIINKVYVCVTPPAYSPIDDPRRFRGVSSYCALDEAGAAFCFVFEVSMARYSVRALDFEQRFRQLAANGPCALSTTGAAYCWGPNDRGQVGDGTPAFFAAPVAVSGNIRFKLTP